jgi:hypothetical protein
MQWEYSRGEVLLSAEFRESLQKHAPLTRFTSCSCASRPQIARNRDLLQGVTNGYPDDGSWSAVAGERLLWSTRRYGVLAVHRRARMSADLAHDIGWDVVRQIQFR